MKLPTPDTPQDRSDDRLGFARAQASRPPVPRLSSRTLLGDGGELLIDHEGREYRLRITQNGKLILTA